MKKLVIFTLLTLFSITLTACGPAYMVKKDFNPPASSFKPSPGKSALVVVRQNTFVGSDTSILTYLDRKFIGATTASTYFAKTDIEPGVKHLITFVNNAESIRIKFEKDRVYFIQLSLYPGFPPGVAINVLNVKGIGDNPLEGNSYYEIKPTQGNQALTPDLTEARYTKYIEQAQILFVNNNGEVELKSHTPADHRILNN